MAVARYEDLWDFDADRHRYAMEASTGYTKFDERGAAAAIHAYGIRPRLIYVVRDPFERIESHYNFMLQDPAWARDITDPSLVQTSNYYLYVEDFSRVFGRENLLILDYAALSRSARHGQPGLRLPRAAGARADRRRLGPQRHRAAALRPRAPAAPARARARPRRPRGGQAAGPPGFSPRSAPTRPA